MKFTLYQTAHYSYSCLADSVPAPVLHYLGVTMNLLVLSKWVLELQMCDMSYSGWQMSLEFSSHIFVKVKTCFLNYSAALVL